MKPMTLSTIRRKLSSWKPDRSDTSLGSVLIKMGCIQQRDVDEATDAKLDNEQLGECMIRLGMISRPSLEAALTYQERMRNGDPVAVMVDLCAARTSQLAQRSITKPTAIAAGKPASSHG